VQAQVVLKSGGTQPHGGGRYFEDDHLQTVNISDELALALGSPTGNSNRIDTYTDTDSIWAGRSWRTTSGCGVPSTRPTSPRSRSTI
jgi:hypothetical protein